MTSAGRVSGAPRRFKPYPAYKDSGVEWLGEIPAHWEVKRLKCLVASPADSTVRTKLPRLDDPDLPRYVADYATLTRSDSLRETTVKSLAVDVAEDVSPSRR